MFELADRLVGIYKTHDATKSVTINPKLFDTTTTSVVLPIMTSSSSTVKPTTTTTSNSSVVKPLQDATNRLNNK